MEWEQRTETSDDSYLREYQKKQGRRRTLKRLTLPVISSVCLLLLLFTIIRFAFVVKTIEIEGDARYSFEEILSACGFDYGDNMITISQSGVEKKLKAEFPYIKSVTITKEFPSKLVLHITEESNVFAYESQGEFFLFNHEMKLMDRFDTYEALVVNKKAIIVKMPEPKSYIVPQYIQMREDDTYVLQIICALSESRINQYVNEFDMTDPFVLRMNCGKNIQVELGDLTNLEGKFSALYRLIGENGSKMSGNVDLSCYPRCFYALDMVEE